MCGYHEHHLRSREAVRGSARDVNTVIGGLRIAIKEHERSPNPNNTGVLGPSAATTAPVSTTGADTDGALFDAVHDVASGLHRGHPARGRIRHGILMSVSSIGAIACSLVLASLPNRYRGLILIVSSFILGAALTVFAFSNSWPLSLLAIVFVGLGQTGRMTLSGMLQQHYMENEFRGRVMAIYMIEFGLTSLSVFVAGVLADSIGVQWAIGGLAIMLMAMCAVVLVVSARTGGAPAPVRFDVSARRCARAARRRARGRAARVGWRRGRRRTRHMHRRPRPSRRRDQRHPPRRPSA